MRAGRLLALLVHLERRGGTTAADLAAALEVSVRTIYRDVAALAEAGVPVWTESGPGGGIRLVEGWRSRLDGLSADEAGALFLAGAPSAVADLGLGTVLAAAQVKVLAGLPPELAGRAARVRERFLADAPGWFHRPDDVPHLATLAEAVWAERRVEVGYARADRTVERVLDPLGLVVKAGTWYLVARSGSDVRTYRVGRVVTATARGDRFERPADFDLAAWWAAASGEFDRTILATRVRLRLTPAAARGLRHVVGVGAADAALAGAVALGDGRVEVDLDVESEPVALDQLTGLGAGVEVVDPPTLRAALAAVGAAMAAVNAPPGTSTPPSGGAGA